tara:strand:+ start:856 stop:996 length:141 start_codon:yes stop_codon:yes gene_type:complete
MSFISYQSISKSDVAVPTQLAHQPPPQEENSEYVQLESVAFHSQPE